MAARDGRGADDALAELLRWRRVQSNGAHDGHGWGTMMLMLLMLLLLMLLLMLTTTTAILHH